MHGGCLVLREQLQKIGAKVELAALDWSTVIARRAEKKPPAAGGWNLMHATWISPDVNNPAVNIGLSGACDKAWFGWSCSEQMEKLRAREDRKSTRLNSSHTVISYAVFCLKKKKKIKQDY